MNTFNETVLYIAGMAGRPSNKEPTASGARLAAFRKAAGLSQVQLSKSLGIPQRTLSFYEREADAIPSSLLPPLADILGVSVEDILGMKNGQSSKRGPKSKLQIQIEQIQRLPKSKQQTISDMLDMAVKSAGV